MAEHRNWSGNVDFSAAERHSPKTGPELADIWRISGHLKAVGTAHSFNRIADTGGIQIATGNLSRVLALDEARGTVTVEAGITYARLAEWLHSRGWALHNLASLPHISVGGAIATATHGSGDRNGNLATAVSALTLHTGSGEVLALSRADHPETFPGAVVSLGALGVVKDITLDLRPSFPVRQTVFRQMPWDQYTEFFDQIHGCAYSVSAFTDWNPAHVGQIWHKAIDSDPDPGREFFGARRADQNLHPIEGTDPVHCTPQCGVPGPWHLRLPHFLPGFMPSRGDEIQSEFFVDRGRVNDALEAVRGIADRIRPCLWISEIRTVAADDLWMSPAHERPVVGIHFTWKKDPEAVDRAVEWVEEALAPVGAVPHWGKVWHRPGPRSQRLEDFRNLVRRCDPERRFHNPLLGRVLDRESRTTTP
jgi:xylitol oxidase